MIHHWRMLLSIFAKRERLQIYLLLANGAVVGLIDVAGVASVMPFIAVLMDDDVIQKNHYLSRAYALFGFESHNHFKVALALLSLGALILSNAFSAFESWFRYRFCFMRTHSLCVRLIAKYLHDPYLSSWNAIARSCKRSSSLTSTASSWYSHGRRGSLPRPVSAGFILALLFAVDPAVTAATLLVLGTSYLALHLTIRKRITALGEEFVVLDTAITARAQEALENAKDIKASGRENEFLNRLRGSAPRVRAERDPP